MDTKPIVAIVRAASPIGKPCACRGLSGALQVPSVLVASAHRTPTRSLRDAEANGLRVIIAGAGGAAALAGMMAAKTISCSGRSNAHRCAQRPGFAFPSSKCPRASQSALAIGKPGATNAALLAGSILALSDATLRGRLLAYREAQTQVSDG